MSVGRTIFYDLENGEVIVDTREKAGSASYRSPEYYISRYTELSERNRDTFEVIELEYGQYAQDFAEANGYRVNPETKKLEFSYPDPNEPEKPPVFQEALSKQVDKLKQEDLNNKEAIAELYMMSMGGF